MWVENDLCMSKFYIIITNNKHKQFDDIIVQYVTQSINQLLIILKFFTKKLYIDSQVSLSLKNVKFIIYDDPLSKNLFEICTIYIYI